MTIIDTIKWLGIVFLITGSIGLLAILRGYGSGGTWMAFIILATGLILLLVSRFVEYIIDNDRED